MNCIYCAIIFVRILELIAQSGLQSIAINWFSFVTASFFLIKFWLFQRDRRSGLLISGLTSAFGALFLQKWW